MIPDASQMKLDVDTLERAPRVTVLVEDEADESRPKYKFEVWPQANWGPMMCFVGTEHEGGDDRAVVKFDYFDGALRVLVWDPDSLGNDPSVELTFDAEGRLTNVLSRKR